MPNQLTQNEMLRHLLKTIQYRMAKVIKDAPDDFGSVSIGHETRTPVEILSHVSDVLGFAVTQWDVDWTGPKAGDWMSEVHRYRATLFALDQLFTKHSVKSDTEHRLVQGPLADVLTHIGQLALMRRFAGAPVPGENFYIVELPAVHAEELT